MWCCRLHPTARLLPKPRPGSRTHGMGGYVPVSRTYRLDPTEGMTSEQSKLVLGPSKSIYGLNTSTIIPKWNSYGAPRYVGPGRGGMGLRKSMRDYAIFPKECRPSGVCVIRAATPLRTPYGRCRRPPQLPTTMPAK